MYRFGKRSIEKMTGLHPELVLVLSRALSISKVDFAVTEGIRSKERQEKLFREGASQTLNSRHLTGDACDLMAYQDGEGSWEWELYEEINEAMQEAASQLGISLTWGGSWKTLKDGAHWQREE